MDDLQQIEVLAGRLLLGLSAGARRALLRQMALALKRRHSQRLAAQRNPDGSGFEPRKAQALRGKRGSLRKNPMFATLRRPKYLRSQVDPAGFWLGFTGRASAIASVHQFGLRDRPAPGVAPVAYPRRELLGVAAADRDMLLDMLYAHVAAD